MARAQEALNRPGANGRRALATGTGALREAESTLKRIRETQRHSDDEHAALEELERTSSGADLNGRIAAAGFGMNPITRPADILARIHASAAAEIAGSDPSSAAPPDE